AAQISNAARQRGIADDRIAPHHREQVVLGDEPLRMLDQIAQNRECSRRELQESLAAPRPFIVRVDADRRKPFMSWSHAAVRFYLDISSSSALASFRSGVSNPSVNQA